jgi:4-carboxymuconolactone decarboxylase
MSRLHRFKPDELSDAQKVAYEQITGGADAPSRYFALADDGSLDGPFNAMLHSPGLGAALHALGAAVRHETRLSARVREIAILVVAAHWRSEFVRASHETVGAASGLSADEMAAIAAGEIPALDDESERAVIDFTRAIVRGDVSDAEWAAAREQLDEATLFELTTLVGYYATLGLQLRVFRVG